MAAQSRLWRSGLISFVVQALCLTLSIPTVTWAEESKFEQSLSSITDKSARTLHYKLARCAALNVSLLWLAQRIKRIDDPETEGQKIMSMEYISQALFFGEVAGVEANETLKNIMSMHEIYSKAWEHKMLVPGKTFDEISDEDLKFCRKSYVNLPPVGDYMAAHK